MDETPLKKRPKRLQIVNELGKPQTLSQAESSFTALKRAPGAILILGLGPSPSVAAALAAESRAGVSYVESEEFASQMTSAWREAVPKGWTRLSPDEAAERAGEFGAILLYGQNPRLFPSFWGPLLAAIRLRLVPGPDAPVRSNAIILPGTENSLLVREMAEAFAHCGKTVIAADPADLPAKLPGVLANGGAGLFFSVNFAGLDPFGQTYYRMRAAGIETAVWCVDNPFHLISGLKAPFWRKAALFVTDDWFLEPLRNEGAERVFHLPLAAPAAFFSPAPLPETPGYSGLAQRILFVGRSRFPGRDAFFAGQTVPPALAAESKDMIARGERPHFGWWREKLGIGALWPGNEGRAAGFGAETASLALRRECLLAALPLGLTIHGDAGWRAELPPGADIRPEVDYYGPLAGMYAKAGYGLNLTSLLLPHGLTQRHFDVFAAGGRLLTDASPGLRLFPRELVQPFVFAGPGDIARVVKRLEGERALRDDLARGMRAHLFQRHRYEHRALAVLEALDAARGTRAHIALDGPSKGD